MQFAREVQRLLVGALLAFMAVVLGAAYWAVVGPDTLLRRDDNPRLVEAEASILRGDLADRDGVVLASTQRGDDGGLRRVYFYPETHGALGYASLRYGVAGAEAAYNALLRGDTLTGGLDDYFDRSILHRPQQGTSVQLTFDLDIQRAAAKAMEGQTGALVVLSAPSGQVLALVSLPTYDPNTLDANWERLASAAGKPFFNRALQSSYQPGTMMYTPLLAGALVSNQRTDALFEGANAMIRLSYDGQTLPITCITPPPASSLTLGEAYVYGCPAPFARIADVLGAPGVQQTFDTFHLYRPLTLDGFAPDAPGTTPAPSATPPLLTDDTLLANALGQGQLTLTPLNMAVILAAVVNDGNAPQPYTLLATRAPAAVDWQRDTTLRPTLPFTTADTAHQLQALLRTGVERGTAQAARVTQGDGMPLDIGGTSGLAYSGAGSKAWFAGFITLNGGQTLVVALVLENSSSADLAAAIGGSVLQAASAQTAGN